MKTKVHSILVALVLILSLSLVIPAPAQAATPANIEDSIVKGLNYLASVQQVDGSWYNSGGPWSDVGTTGLVVLKFEDRAKELNLDPFDTVHYSYAINVINGLNYIFNYAASNAQPGIHFPLLTTSDT